MSNNLTHVPCLCRTIIFVFTDTGEFATDRRACLPWSSKNLFAELAKEIK